MGVSGDDTAFHRRNHWGHEDNDQVHRTVVGGRRGRWHTCPRRQRRDHDSYGTFTLSSCAIWDDSNSLVPYNPDENPFDFADPAVSA
jgi:hypothetical protein